MGLMVKVEAVYYFKTGGQIGILFASDQPLAFNANTGELFDRVFARYDKDNEITKEYRRKLVARRAKIEIEKLLSENQ